MKSILSLLFLLAPAAGLCAEPPHSRAELVSEVQAIEPGRPFWAAVRLEIDEGWHTYWRNPGDSGEPVKVAWHLPGSFEAGEPRWPPPKRISVPPLVNYGYEELVYLPVRITPSPALRPGETVVLSAEVDLLVCKEECLGETHSLSLELPVESGLVPDVFWTQVLDDVRGTLPGEPDGLLARAELEDDAIRLRLRAAAEVPVAAEFFPINEMLIEHAAPQTLRKEDGGWTLTLKRDPRAPELPGTLDGVLVMEEPDGSTRAVRLSLPLISKGAGLFGALLLAFGGGLLLNLMPCVFPVLSLKVMGFMEQAEGSSAALRKHGLAFGSGVMVSFWALAGLLLGLRAAGESIGWGYQLQSPGFVAFLAGLFFVMGLSFLGVFEVGASMIGLGAKLGKGEGLWGSFLTGMLATVIATPCTAPFMGTALGYALVVPAAAALAVFSALAAGMAAPYVVISFRPGLMKLLPRPGAWMETLKQVLAFPLLGTVVWLAWVHALQTGADGTARLLAGLLVLGLGAWGLGKWGVPATSFRARNAARAGALAAILAAAGLWGASGDPRAAGAADPSDGVWRPYSETALKRLRAEGRPVFVDFTAAWCVTCQVNKRTTLNTGEVLGAFRERRVALLRADWTNRDPVITRALESFGRSGVPLYVLYAGDKPPVLLPVTLTRGTVLDALKDIPVVKEETI